MEALKFLPFHPDFAASFAELNRAWLEQYFYVEPIDEEILSHPETIIESGGQIYFALLNGAVVGTFALLPASDGSFELGKMAVSQALRGGGIGGRMLQFCITEARRLGITRLFLFSNTKLAPAIHLYRKHGFREVPLGQTEYKRSDIRMELDPALLQPANQMV